MRSTFTFWCTAASGLVLFSFLSLAPSRAAPIRLQSGVPGESTVHLTAVEQDSSSPLSFTSSSTSCCTGCCCDSRYSCSLCCSSATRANVHAHSQLQNCRIWRSVMGHNLSYCIGHFFRQLKHLHCEPNPNYFSI